MWRLACERIGSCDNDTFSVSQWIFAALESEGQANADLSKVQITIISQIFKLLSKQARNFIQCCRLAIFVLFS